MLLFVLELELGLVLLEELGAGLDVVALVPRDCGCDVVGG